MAIRGQHQSLPPRRYPALKLVPHGKAIINGKQVTLMHIERESEWEMIRRERGSKPGNTSNDIPPGKPGRPRKHF